MHDDPFSPHNTEGELHADWNMQMYLQSPAISRSGLWRVYHDSPADYQWYKLHDDGESDALRLGTAIHVEILEPENRSQYLAVYEGKRDKRVKKYQEFLAGPGLGKTVLTPSQAAHARRVADYVSGLKGVRRLLDEGLTEQTGLWTDESGERCKMRADFLHPASGWVWDIKSTREDLKSTWPLMRAVKRYGYHLQAAMIQDGLAANDIELKDYWILWIRKDDPPRARLTRLPGEALREGRAVFREAITKYAVCRAANAWPAPEYVPEDLPWETEL